MYNVLRFNRLHSDNVLMLGSELCLKYKANYITTLILYIVSWVS